MLIFGQKYESEKKLIFTPKKTSFTLQFQDSWIAFYFRAKNTVVPSVRIPDFPSISIFALKMKKVQFCLQFQVFKNNLCSYKKNHFSVHIFKCISSHKHSSLCFSPFNSILNYFILRNGLFAGCSTHKSTQSGILSPNAI